MAATDRVRTVLDPNVIISGLISREGTPARVLKQWQEGHFQVFASPLVLEELRRALDYPKLRRLIPPDEAKAALGWVAANAMAAEDVEPAGPIRSADPGDDYLIALAQHEKAALVSGDKHLLELAGRIPVYSPREFLDLVESQGG